MRCPIPAAVLIVGLAMPAWANLALREWPPLAEPGGAEARAPHQSAGHQGGSEAHFELDAIEREAPPVEPEAAPTEAAGGEAQALPQGADHLGDSGSRFELGAIEREPAGGRFGVQLGAFRRAGRADVAWEQLRAAHPDLLGGLGAVILYTEQGSEAAAVNRLVAGGFETKAAAQHLCDRLKQRGVDCFVPRP